MDRSWGGHMVCVWGARDNRSLQVSSTWSVCSCPSLCVCICVCRMTCACVQVGVCMWACLCSHTRVRGVFAVSSCCPCTHLCGVHTCELLCACVPGVCTHISVCMCLHRTGCAHCTCVRSGARVGVCTSPCVYPVHMWVCVCLCTRAHICAHPCPHTHVCLGARVLTM